MSKIRTITSNRRRFCRKPPFSPTFCQIHSVFHRLFRAGCAPLSNRAPSSSSATCPHFAPGIVILERNRLACVILMVSGSPMFKTQASCTQQRAAIAGCRAGGVDHSAGQRLAAGLGRRPRRLPGGIILASVLIMAAGARAFAQSPSREVITRGESQFKQSCGFCHAPDATGARGPDLIRSKVVAHDVNGNLIGEVIRNWTP